MHSWLGDAIPTLVLLHVLAAFLFVLMHGPSVFAMLALRSERQTARVQALLDLSRLASGLSWASWAFLGGTGALVAFAEHTWARPWVWGSAVVLGVVSGVMSPLMARPFNEARHAAGLPWFDGRGVRAPGPVDEAALAGALAQIRARSVPTVIVGVVGLVILVWLMVAKPGWS